MRIIKLLNTISPEIYFNNIFEYLFGSRNYRITQYFLEKIKSVGLSNSKTTGEITVNLLENKSFEIVCKKPFFFRQNYNSFQNMRAYLNKKMTLMFIKQVETFISMNSQYEKYTRDTFV